MRFAFIVFSILISVVCLGESKGIDPNANNVLQQINRTQERDVGLREWKVFLLEKKLSKFIDTDGGDYWSKEKIKFKELWKMYKEKRSEFFDHYSKSGKQALLYISNNQDAFIAWDCPHEIICFQVSDLRPDRILKSKSKTARKLLSEYRKKEVVGLAGQVCFDFNFCHHGLSETFFRKKLDKFNKDFSGSEWKSLRKQVNGIVEKIFSKTKTYEADCREKAKSDPTVCI